MAFEWLTGQGLEQLPLYLIALAIGLLISRDRERTPTAKAGLRTCALVALIGAVGLAAVALMMIEAYYHHHEAFHEWDSGTTTRLFGMTQLSAAEATAAIVVAVSANAVSKLGIVSVAGGQELFYRCVPVIVAILIGSALVLALIS